MNKILLTTTALVAFAGAAAASDITWGGEAGIEYDIEGSAFSWSAEVDFGLTQELNNGAVASLSYGAEFVKGTFTWDDLPVIMLETSYGSISAGDIENAADDVMPETIKDFMIDTDGRGDSDDHGRIHFGNSKNHIVRTDITLGGVDIAASTKEKGDNVAVAISGSMGGVDFGLVADSRPAAKRSTQIGVYASTSIGAADINFVYADQRGHNPKAATAYGVDGTYALSSALTLSAGYASYEKNYGKPKGNEGTYKNVGLDWDNGAGFTAGFDYDIDNADVGLYSVSAGYVVAFSADTTATLGVSMDEGADAEFTVDVAHMMGDLSVYAGYDTDGENVYAGVVYDLGSDAEAYVYYSDNAATDADELGPEEWSQGTVAGISITF